MQFQDLSYSYSNGFAIRAEGLTDRLMKQNWEPRYKLMHTESINIWQGVQKYSVRKR